MENIMITADTKTHSLSIPHLGFTLRTIMGAGHTAASEMKTYRRKWNLVYKDVKIGTIQLASSDLESQEKVLMACDFKETIST